MRKPPGPLKILRFWWQGPVLSAAAGSWVEVGVVMGGVGVAEWGWGSCCEAHRVK